MIAHVSASLGGLDSIHPVPRLAGLRSTYYTDRTDTPSALLGWNRVVKVVPAGDVRLASKLYKCQINRTADAEDASWYLWTDGCIRIHSLDFVADLVDDLGESGRRGAFVPHPERSTVAAEYEHVLTGLRQRNRYLTARYSIEAMETERDYFARSHDLGALPLWCGGLWLLPASTEVERFLIAWWWTVRNLNVFDQCAISPLLVESGVEPVAFKRNIYGCEFWTRFPHA